VHQDSILSPCFFAIHHVKCWAGWSMAWRILSIILLVCEISATVQSLNNVWHSFFGIGMKPDPSCLWPLLIFPTSFRIWNSSTGIPSPPLALFIVMPPKAHLTLHSRMSGCRWMFTPLWLSGSLRSFLYRSVYSCHLFLIPLLLVDSYCFDPLLCTSLDEMFLWYL